MKLPIIIKKRQASYPLYTAISIVMLCIALLFLFFPFIPVVTKAMSSSMITAYMIIGGICTMFFAFTTSVIIFSIVSPPTAIKITKNGIYDYTMAGVGAGFIPKDAIISLKKFGSKNGQFLGIKLDTKYLDMLSSDKKVRQEISANINSGLPAVIIRQNDIRMSIDVLLSTVLEAYADVSVEKKIRESRLENVLPVQDIEPITITEDEHQSQKEAPAEDDNAICTVDEQDTTINYKTFSLSSVEDDYTPILVNPEKPRIKTVDDLLAQLNITKSAPSKADEADSEQK